MARPKILTLMWLWLWLLALWMPSAWCLVPPFLSPPMAHRKLQRLTIFGPGTATEMAGSLGLVRVLCPTASHLYIIKLYKHTENGRDAKRCNAQRLTHSPFPGTVERGKQKMYLGEYQTYFSWFQIYF